MKVTGFTIIRNAITYDYPIVEAIQSVLPICDNFVIAVGSSDDATLALIQSIDPDKIKIIETVWDDSLRKGGKVLADETNKAFKAIDDDSDWAFYIQGDEVVHQDYLNNIKNAMLKYKDDSKVDGLLFKYLHFFGSYDYLGSSPRWYPHEIRVIKNNKNIYSYRDAQGFRKDDNQKLKVKAIDAYMYHYGWVKDPQAQQRKQETFNALWHNDEWMEKNVIKAEAFDYSFIDALSQFKGTHPKVIQERIQKMNWTYDHDMSMNKMSIKHRFKLYMREHFNITIGYKNYKKI